MTSQGRRLRTGDDLVIIHDFNARGPDELTLRRGEIIKLMELDDDFGDGWYLGKSLKSGATGLFPGVYTTVAPKGRIQQETGVLQAGRAGPVADDTPVHQPSQRSVDTRRRPSASDIQSSDMVSPTDIFIQSSLPPHPISAMTVDIHNSVRQSIGNHLNGQESPVMNETLSVIDEHITDFSTPRHSLAAQDSRINDSGSDYSAHIDHNLSSYVNGDETDEEEENRPSEDEVRRWNYIETARHLRDNLGVEAKHTDIFEEQEISGDVLLDMNQDFVFMKEFDFGVMGRRLKTWHKIKAFQEDVKFKRPPRTSISSSPGPSDERKSSRSGQPAAFLPRIPSLSEKSATETQETKGLGSAAQYPQAFGNIVPSNTSSPVTPHTPVRGMDSQRRPSAASIRELNHSRRHSSIDTTTQSSGSADPSPLLYHRKRGSFDRSWSMAGGSQRLPPRPATSFIATTNSMPLRTSRDTGSTDVNSGVVTSEKYDDFNRGYFSGPEVDLRKSKRVLTKRLTAKKQSGDSSYNDGQFSAVSTTKRHSHTGSVDSIRDAADHMSAAAKAYHGQPRGRFRSLSSRGPDRPGSTSSTSAPSTGKANASMSDRSSPVHLHQFKNAGPKFRRAMGLRPPGDTASRRADTAASSSSLAKDNDAMLLRTGSTTPSATSRSSGRHSTDGSWKVTDGGTSAPRPIAPTKSVSKSKRDTSAYMRGLENKPPREQMKDCDYSGWMKKRSSNLMATWKPRLFVLRGRRLSYYYSEDDTEERGLIDITAHRVLRADNDPAIALYATITWAAASATAATSPNRTGSQFSSDKLTADARGENDGNGPFFFKLVPPRAGSSRSVQFTKPTIHYFQTDNVQEGRLWMAALMKATIDRDMDMPIEMTNKQKTISLKQARKASQRPPALRDTEANITDEKPDNNSNETSLLERKPTRERSKEKPSEFVNHELKMRTDSDNELTNENIPKLDTAKVTIES